MMKSSVELLLVKRSDSRYQTIRNRHYVANHGAIGRQLHYLVLVDGNVVGIISGASAVWATAPRDSFFGINSHNRELVVGRYIVNNTVFRLEVRQHNLGTQVLALWRRRIAQDWKRFYFDPVFGFETFIWGENRTGSLYLADNWHNVGETSGSTKFKPNGMYNATTRKEVEKKLIFCRWMHHSKSRKEMLKQLEHDHNNPAPRTMSMFEE